MTQHDLSTVINHSAESETRLVVEQDGTLYPVEEAEAEVHRTEDGDLEPRMVIQLGDPLPEPKNRHR